MNEIQFEEVVVDKLRETVEIYFNIPKELFIEQFPSYSDAEYGTVMLLLPLYTTSDQYWELRWSPTKDDLDYDWHIPYVEFRDMCMLLNRAVKCWVNDPYVVFNAMYIHG